MRRGQWEVWTSTSHSLCLPGVKWRRELSTNVHTAISKRHSPCVDVRSLEIRTHGANDSNESPRWDCARRKYFRADRKQIMRRFVPCFRRRPNVDRRRPNFRVVWSRTCHRRSTARGKRLGQIPRRVEMVPSLDDSSAPAIADIAGGFQPPPGFAS